MDYTSVMKHFKDVQPGERFKFTPEGDTIWKRCSANFAGWCNCYCVDGRGKGTFGYVAANNWVYPPLKTLTCECGKTISFDPDDEGECPRGWLTDLPAADLDREEPLTFCPECVLKEIPVIPMGMFE